MIPSVELNKLKEKIASGTLKNISLSDIALAPYLAASIPTKSVYVTQSKDAVTSAVQTLGHCGLRALGVNSLPEPPLFTTKDVPCPISSALQKFLSNEVDVLVLYAPVLFHTLPVFQSAPLSINVGDKISIRQVKSFLENSGLNIFVQGDVITYNVGNIPTRIMFYGNQIEAIKIGGKAVLTLDITPAANLTITPSQARIALEKIKPTHENTTKIVHQIQATIEKESLVIGTRWLAPLVFPTQTVADMIADQTTVYELPHQINESLAEFQKSFSTKISSLIDGGLLLPEHVHNAKIKTPKKLYEFSTGSSSLLLTLPVPNFYNSFSALVPDIQRNLMADKSVIVFAGTTPALGNYLLERNIPFNDGKLTLLKKDLNLSLELPKEKLVIYSITQPPIYQDSVALKKSESTFVLPDIGDIVVHEFHGLGRFVGMQELEFDKELREFITLQYDGGAIVYVPKTQVHILSNYIGEPTRLNRIGGQDFTNVKQRLRRRLAELSKKLVKLYAKRSLAAANTYPIEKRLVDEFVAAFPHGYTSDQKSALEDIMSDMSSEKIMDRLICGDVGVGKTEVALVAAFRAVMCGYQVALLCPTTILSEQHYATIYKRLGSFGARVEVLNRFKSDKEAQKILSAVEHGEVDILIGTHRILSSDVRFKNLSLLILDEEQRFGVTHKEKIKHLKTNIDVLTLSATPIPRTLNMALLGIRDISTINTPPQNRKSILTYITEFSDELVNEAISRELHRGGQTLVLYNRVETIDNFARKLKGRVAVAHGQMREADLEAVIKKLYNHEIDVLVCSTIIENGVDIATANTLVVIDADKLGVAQMHQIRGRVGRSDKQAFAYFTYPKARELSSIARERLEAIRQHSKHGSGLNIAMRDLQLRGSGDILGENQSGHINQVGFELYTRILAEVASQTRHQDVQQHQPQF